MVKKRTPPAKRKPDRHGLIYPDSRAAVVRCDRHGDVFEPCFACQIERKHGDVFEPCFACQIERKREAAEAAKEE
jgi:hypothetical protein